MPRPSAVLPPPRVGAQLVHDPIRQRTVLFGGSDPGTTNLRGDHWEWDGVAWTQRVLPTMPSPRERHAMVFDTARGRILLHGGRVTSQGVAAGDTWEYDGTTWTQRTPAHGPAGRLFHALACDPGRQRIVMFGGAPTSLNETWEWDGTDWLLQNTPTAPPARTDHTMLFDSVRQRTVLAGGYSYSGSLGVHQDTWEWDGTAWQQRASTLPFPGTSAPTATDPTTGSVLAFRGDTVWQWNGTSWIAQQSVSWPPASDAGSPACTDTARNRVVVVQGSSTVPALPLTWEWDGATWARRTAVGPALTVGAALAFDAGRGRSVLFGRTDTWEWDGSVWTQPSPAVVPPTRTGHAMAYDAARQCVVLFGGTYFVPMQGPAYRTDTWTWNGINWVQQAPAAAPSGRSGHAMAYDPVRQRVVLFGGGILGSTFDDTWEWDGSNWIALAPAVRPSQRQAHSMVFDPQQGAVVLFGGRGTLASQMFGDTWHWNGTTWTQMVTTSTPPARASASIAIDPATSQVLLHGGIDANAQRDDTWLLGAPVLATSTELGSGCAVGSPPRLLAQGPYLGNADFRFEALGAASSAPCVFGFASSTAAQPIGPCTLYLQNAFTLLLTTTNPWGVAKFPIPLPYAASLRGVTLSAQVAVLNAPGGWAGLDFTAARTIVVGD
jgi:hypothetical protein